jgi:hypothetical protein
MNRPMAFVLLKNNEADRERSLRQAIAILQRLPLDKAWSVKVEEKKPTRSENQNSLLWALYTDILRMGGEAMRGWTKEDLHEFFLSKHFGDEVREIFGRKRRVPIQRSSNLSKQDFSDFVESIVIFMAEQGVVLSLPGDLERAA